MLIAIFSDLHDNLNNWQKFNHYLKQKNIKTLLFAGDLTKDSTLNIIKKDFKHKIFLVRGNAELYQNKDIAKEQIIELEKIKIGLTHHPQSAKQLIHREKNLDFIFYGHSHRPYLEKINNCYLVNPGNLNDQILATFALLNTKTKNISLKKL